MLKCLVSSYRWPWLLGLALLAAILLRLIAIGYGLPNTFNADEPHLVNSAVAFGGGSLSPYSFKYPTLWPYLLFFCYGVFFVLWSGFGFLHSVTEFIGLYAWHPTPFYLIGRILSAAFSLGALYWLARADAEDASAGEPKPWPWAALLLAFCPVLIELAHSCKPDSLMFFCVCAGWYWALRIYSGGQKRSYWWCGLSLGLALSSQYTAAPTLILLPLAHLLGRAKPKPWMSLGQGLAAAALGFLAGSPYVLLDFPKFWASVSEMNYLYLFSTTDPSVVLRTIHFNVATFAGEGSLAIVFALWGLGILLRREPRKALLLLTPVLAYVAVLANNPDGGWMRYLAGCFPGLALLASEGLRSLERSGRKKTFIVAAALTLAPGVVFSAFYVRDLRLPDTRTLVEAWIKANIPPGTVILLDLPHTGPRLDMTKEQSEELWHKTDAAGSPRAKLFKAMAATHPGGGYRLYRIQRSAKDLWTAPRLVTQSQADSDSLDLRGGLDHARAARVEYVVLSGFGVSPERAPELSSFFAELAQEGELVQELLPDPGRIYGASMRVYRLRRP